MPAFAKISKTDYNNIRNKLVNIIGSGSADSGWGQTLISSSVDESNKITINEYNNLRFDIINAYKHIFGSNPIIVQPVEGNTVRYSETFVPNTTTDAPVTQYDTYANTIINNRFTVDASQSGTFSWPATSTAWPGVYGAAWTSRIQCTVTASWPSATAARHFFNSGGEIRFAASRSGGSGTQQNTAWTDLLSGAGTRAFGANKPSTGTSPANGQNWFRLTSSYQQWYSVSSSTPYGANNYVIFARTPAVANNSAGTASVVEFLLQFNDGYFDPGPNVPENPAPGDAVDGTFSISASHLFATGVLEPTGRGNFTVTQPTISLGVIAPA
jgi:hypothetical protein